MATPRSTRDPLFLGRWFQDEVIIVAVRWYLTYPLSYRQICEMLQDLRKSGERVRSHIELFQILKAC